MIGRGRFNSVSGSPSSCGNLKAGGVILLREGYRQGNRKSDRCLLQAKSGRFDPGRIGSSRSVLAELARSGHAGRFGHPGITRPWAASWLRSFPLGWDGKALTAL